MVLSIKLRDNIFVPQTIIDSGKYLFGLDYSAGQNVIRSFNLTKDETSFDIFFTKILNLFKPNLVFNLYHLVNSVELAEATLLNDYYNKNIIATVPFPTSEMFRSTDNFLSYFGFEIVKYPSKNQFDELVALKAQHIITHFWIEGNTQQIQSVAKKRRSNSKLIPVSYDRDITQTQFQTIVNPNSPQISTTDSIQNLAFENLPKRGAGATIISIEEDATDNRDKLSIGVNTAHFSDGSASFGILGKPRFGNEHQINTLRTLYGDSKGFFKGISPYANLIVCSLDYMDPSASLNDNFVKKKTNVVNIISQIRKNLFTVYKQNFQNAILLFEFETWIPFSKKLNDGEYFPTAIIYDIEKWFSSLSKEGNIIVTCPSGNKSNDFDHLKTTPWKIRPLEYVDLTEKNLPFILVGATEVENGNFKVSKATNYGKNLDVYMYTNFKVAQNIFYIDTSGAVAVVAGIVAYLQGMALSVGNLSSQNSAQPQKLTTKIIKDVFKNTFMKGFPRDTQMDIISITRGIINPTVTLEKLWAECEIILKRQPSQHQ